jgi:hypothetical protein
VSAVVGQGQAVADHLGVFGRQLLPNLENAGAQGVRLGGPGSAPGSPPRVPNPARHGPPFVLSREIPGIPNQLPLKWVRTEDAVRYGAVSNCVLLSFSSFLSRRPLGICLYPPLAPLMISPNGVAALAPAKAPGRRGWHTTFRAQTHNGITLRQNVPEAVKGLVGRSISAATVCSAARAVRHAGGNPAGGGAGGIEP